MDQTAWTALMTAAGGLCGGLVTLAGAVGAAAVAWLKLRHRMKRESDRDSLAHYEGVIDALERQASEQAGEMKWLREQNRRHAAHAEETSAVVERLRMVHSACQQSLDALYAWAARYAASTPGVPPPPSCPPRPGGVEHEARTVQQQAVQLRELAEEGPPGRPPEGGAPK